MKALALILATYCFPLTAVFSMPQAQTQQPPSSWAEQLSYAIPARLLQMPMPFDIEYNAEVKRQLTDYLRQGRRSTEFMLARRSMYFPIFEHYRLKYKLPEILKYIPCWNPASCLRPCLKPERPACGSSCPLQPNTTASTSMNTSMKG